MTTNVTQTADIEYRLSYRDDGSPFVSRIGIEFRGDGLPPELHCTGHRLSAMLVKQVKPRLEMAHLEREAAVRHLYAARLAVRDAVTRGEDGEYCERLRREEECAEGVVMDATELVRSIEERAREAARELELMVKKVGVEYQRAQRNRRATPAPRCRVTTRRAPSRSGRKHVGGNKTSSRSTADPDPEPPNRRPPAARQEVSP